MSILALLCPLTFLILGLAASGLLAFLAFRGGQMKVQPAEVVRCKVAEMRDGVCRVRGRLTPRGALLKSPLTNKPCVFFRFKVEQAYIDRTWTTTGSILSDDDTRISDRESWRLIIDDAERIAVALEDETGTAYLDLEEAQCVALGQVKEGIIDTSQRDNLWFELMLQKRYGGSTLVGRRKYKGGGGAARYGMRVSWQAMGHEAPKARVFEEVVEAGLEVIVVGEVETRPGKPPRFRPVDHPLVVTTKPSRASLPTPRGPALALWIAAAVTLAATLLLSFLGAVAVVANLAPASPRAAPPASRPWPGR